MFWIWLTVIILLTIAEIMTINLVTIWFVVSAIVSLVLSFFIDSFAIQFAVFALLGVILLVTTRQTLKRLINQRKQSTNIDRIIGMTGIVVEEIDKNKNGAVKVDGKIWTAVADKNIKIDSAVKVLEIQSAKIKVEEA